MGEVGDVAAVQPPMAGVATVPLLVFVLGRQLFGVCVGIVDRVYPAVSIAPLQGGPPVVAGVIGVHGEVLAVLDLGRRHGEPIRQIGLDFRIVIVRGRTHRLALLAESVDGVRQIPTRTIAAAEQLVPGLALLKGVALAPDGFVHIQDAETLLSVGDERRLADALRRLDAA